MFVVAGEALVDIVVPPDGPVEHAPGGSPLNVAVGLSRLGIDTTLLTRLGTDDHGHLVLDHLTRSNVRLGDGAVAAGTRTSTATAHLDEARAATYDFDLTWALPRQRLPADANGLHVGSIGTALRPGRDAVVDLVEQAHGRGLFVSYDPNARPAFLPEPAQAWRDLREIAARADLVKLSDEDVGVLAPGREPAQVAAELLEAGASTRIVVVTHGGAAAEAFTTAGHVRVPAPRVQVVDTVGAGDSFMAALVAVLLEREGRIDDRDVVDLTELLSAAHAVAAITCGRRGADPPRRDELPSGWPKAPPDVNP